MKPPQSRDQLKGILKPMKRAYPLSLYYSTTVNNRPGGANNESRGRFLWSWYWFLWSWGWFSGNKRSGKPLRLLRLRNHPQDHKNQHQNQKNLPRDSLLGPPRDDA